MAERKINILLNEMKEIVRESRKYPKKVQANGKVLMQYSTLVNDACLVTYTKRHDKSFINDLLDRTEELPDPKKELTKAARTLGKHSHKKGK